MDTQAMITIAITTHNRYKELKYAIESVLNQSVLPKQIIIVDDGSSTPIPQEILNSAPPEIDLILIRNETPTGAAKARNTAILHASQKYISFLDDDDTFHPKKIEKIIEEIEEKKYPDLIYNSAKITLANEKITYRTKRNNSNYLAKEILIKNIFGGASLVTCKKSSLLDIGLFDIEMQALEDYELWIRFCQKYSNITYIEAPLTNYFYRTQSSSLSKSEEKNIKAFSYIRKKHLDLFKNLSPKEEVKRQVNICHDHILRGLINYDKKKTFIWCFIAFKIQPSIKNLLLIIITLFGTKTYFKLRSLY